MKKHEGQASTSSKNKDQEDMANYRAMLDRERDKKLKKIVKRKAKEKKKRAEEEERRTSSSDSSDSSSDSSDSDSDSDTNHGSEGGKDKKRKRGKEKEKKKKRSKDKKKSRRHDKERSQEATPPVGDPKELQKAQELKEEAELKRKKCEELVRNLQSAHKQ